MFTRRSFSNAAEFAIEAAQDALVVLDNRMRFIQANTVFYEIFPQAVGLKKGDVITERAWWPGELRNLDTTVKSGTPVEFVLKEGGALRYMTAMANRVEERCHHGYWTILIHDSSEMVNFLRRLETIANIDGLTGIYNRRYFMETAGQAFVKSKRSGMPCSVILFDLDYLKKINDTYGHQAGDTLLRSVADNVKKVLRPYDQLARYGGDEFIIFTEAGEDFAMRLARRVRDAVGSTVHYFNGAAIRCRVSCGVAVCTDNIKTLDALISNADLALYRAKHYGRNRIELYNDNVLITQIMRAVENDYKGFTLYYQPIFAIKPWRLAGVECLLRWQSPSGEIVAPSLLIPRLSQLGLMEKLDRWALNTACKQCKKWMAQLDDPSFYMHINVSQHVLTQSALCEDVIATVERSGVSPGNVVLEFKEIPGIIAPGDEMDALRKLRENDIHVAIDNFGDAKTSISAMRNMFVDELRIDRSIIKDIEYDLSSRRFLSGLVYMSRDLKHRICALGVETEWQRNFIEKLGIDNVQGYLTGVPEDCDTFWKQYVMSESKMSDCSAVAAGV